MRPIPEDALDGAFLVSNLAMVYAWANESNLAFEQLIILIEAPNSILTYGSPTLDPAWDPIRTDPRFNRESDKARRFAYTGFAKQAGLHLKKRDFRGRGVAFLLGIKQQGYDFPPVRAA
jgi:hypothetical protein